MSKRIVLLFALVLGLITSVQAQTDGCKSATGHQASHDMRWMGSGVLLAPRRAVKLSNIKWELPVLAATVLMVNYGDTPASRRIDNVHVENAANRFSNIGEYTEWGLAGALFAVGCAKQNDSMRSAGLQALGGGGGAIRNVNNSRFGKASV